MQTLFSFGGGFLCVGQVRNARRLTKNPSFFSPCFGPRKRRPFSGHISRANKVRPNCWASPFWHPKGAHFPGPKIGPSAGAVFKEALGFRFFPGEPCVASPLVHGRIFSQVPGTAWMQASSTRLLPFSHAAPCTILRNRIRPVSERALTRAQATSCTCEYKFAASSMLRKHLFSTALSHRSVVFHRSIFRTIFLCAPLWRRMTLPAAQVLPCVLRGLLISQFS